MANFSVTEQNEIKAMQLISEIIFCAKGFQAYQANQDELIIEQRNQIVAKLLNLKNKAYPIYGATVTDLLQAALIYYTDEVVHERLGFKQWHLLQEELLNCNDGGQHFFELCQQVIDNPSMPMVTHKTLYMILSNQFRGIYFDDINQRNLIKQKLRYHIERNDSWINSSEQLTLPDPILQFSKHHWYNRLSNRYFTNIAAGLFGLSLVTYISIYFLL